MQEVQEEDPVVVHVAQDASQSWQVRSEVLPHNPAGQAAKHSPEFKKLVLPQEAHPLAVPSMHVKQLKWQSSQVHVFVFFHLPGGHSDKHSPNNKKLLAGHELHMFDPAPVQVEQLLWQV